ncbi:MAG: energy transducer TonB [Woeseiaceae bacterium]|nr:energy transducer TonB [Woeseiaceae bacterium]
MNIRHIAGVVLVLAAMVDATPAAAQKYEFKIQNTAVGSEPVEQPYPAYPSRVRPGQEGWVRVNYVITPDGKAVSPIVIDSVGGAVFEAAVIDRMPDWRFEPPGEERANNITTVRFEMFGGRDRATSNFMRRTQSVMESLALEQDEDARERVDAIFALGGWNLYESTMLWLMAGRLAGAEGDPLGKLEGYRRALGVGNRNALNDRGLRDLLKNLFKLEMELGQYAAARRSLDRLKSVPGSEPLMDELAEGAARLEQQLAADEPLVARARLYRPDSSSDGVALWSYVPARRTFSFDALSGNVERFEVRCERDRLEGPVAAGKTWSLPEGKGDCRVFVFGESDAGFEFVEHNASESVNVAARTAVARNDVLD